MTKTQSMPQQWGAIFSYEDAQKIKALVGGFIPGLSFPPDYEGTPCFPAGAPIRLPDGSVCPIEDIAAGDAVAAYGAPSWLAVLPLFPRDAAEAHANPVTAPLTGGIVTRLFNNLTTEWIELNWTDPATGEARSLTATPGHVMLTPQGGWKQLIEMVEGNPTLRFAPPSPDRGGKGASLSRHSFPGTGEVSALSPSKGRTEGELTKGEEFGTEIGRVGLVTAEGAIVTARAYLLQYCAATAHLFEEAEMLVTRTEGGLAVKPKWKKGWKTYNFEVEKYHTYIAGGIRVHNMSELGTAGFGAGNFVAVGSGIIAALAAA